MNSGHKFEALLQWTDQLPYRIHFAKMSELKKKSARGFSQKNPDEKHLFSLGLTFQAMKSCKLVSVLRDIEISLFCYFVDLEGSYSVAKL